MLRWLESWASNGTRVGAKHVNPPWWRSAKNEAVLRQLVNVLARRGRGTRWREVCWIRLGGLERIGLQLEYI
jgi:hypothetical protein